MPLTKPRSKFKFPVTMQTYPTLSLRTCSGIPFPWAWCNRDSSTSKMCIRDRFCPPSVSASARLCLPLLSPNYLYPVLVQPLRFPPAMFFLIGPVVFFTIHFRAVPLRVSEFFHPYHVNTYTRRTKVTKKKIILPFRYAFKCQKVCLLYTSRCV